MFIKSFIDYLTYEKKYSTHTITAYETDIQSFLKFYQSEFESANLLEVEYNQIRSWIVKLVNSNITNRTVNRKISSLKTFYKFLQKTNQVENNPLHKHKALKVAKKVQVPFSENEIESILEMLEKEKDFKSLRDKLIIELFYSTGMRRNELIQIKLKDIDIVKRTVKVLGKRNKERLIPLINSVNETLKLYLKERNKIATKSNDYLLITDKGKKTYPTFVYRIINSYFSIVSSKIKKSPHVIRHSFATHLLNEGANLNSVKELLGHASLASTQVYTHSSLGKLKEVYNQAHPRSNKI